MNPYDMSSQKVSILASYIGIQLKTELINIEQMEHYSNGFFLKSSITNVPVLQLDNGQLLTEIPAILLYLMSYKHIDDDSHAAVWNHIEIANMARINQLLEFDYIVLQPLIDNQFMATLKYGTLTKGLSSADLTEAIVWLNGYLKGRKFMALNQFTVADIALAVSISHLRAFGLITTSYTMLNDWHERIKMHLSKFHYVDIVELYAIELGERYMHQVKVLRSANKNS